MKLLGNIGIGAGAPTLADLNLGVRIVEKLDIAYRVPELVGANFFDADEAINPEPNDFVIGCEGTDTVIKRYKDFNGKPRAVITKAGRTFFERGLNERRKAETYSTSPAFGI